MASENNFTNPQEQSAEYIPNKEEILREIAAFCENPVPLRVLEDARGIYLLEVEVRGEKAGESTLYIYQRQGTFPNKNVSAVTTIHVIPFEDGMPVSGGYNVADYNSVTKKWERT